MPSMSRGSSRPCARSTRWYRQTGSDGASGDLRRAHPIADLAWGNSVEFRSVQAVCHLSCHARTDAPALMIGGAALTGATSPGGKVEFAAANPPAQAHTLIRDTDP